MAFKVIAKQIVSVFARVSPLRSAVHACYELKSRSRYGVSWAREHPYDRAHGVRTSGAVPGYVVWPGDPVNTPTTGYIAIQPSIVRAALEAIPEPQHCHFLDFGCGKGRSLFVATELGFRTITGVEFSLPLSRIARRNAAAFSRTHSARTRVDIVTGDALAYNLPAEKLVIFLYNPFGRPLIAQLLANVETSLRTTPRDLYIVYCNPAHGEIFDASASLTRRYASQIPYDPSEIGYGPNEAEAVVIWQNRDNPYPCPPGDPTAPIIIVIPGTRVEIGASPEPKRAQHSG